MRKSIHKILRITVLLLVILMTCTAFSIHSFAATPSEIKDANQKLLEEKLKALDEIKAGNTSSDLGRKINTYVIKYYERINNISGTQLENEETEYIINLYYNQGIVSSQVARIYYSNINDIDNEDVEGTPYTVHSDIQERIYNSTDLSSVSDAQKADSLIDLAEDTYANGGYYACMSVAAYTEKLDLLLAGGSQSEIVKSLIDTAKTEIVNCGNHNSENDYATIYENAKNAVYLQRNKESNRESISALFHPHDSDTAGKIANSIISEYNDANGLIEQCQSASEVALEYARAVTRRSLYDYYFSTISKINEYGNYPLILNHALEEYRKHDGLIMDFGCDETTAYTAQYDKGVAALDGVVDEAQAQSYIDGHVGAISAATATKDNIKQAIKDAELLDDEVKALLGDTFESLAKNYKDIVKGEIIDTVGDGKLSQDVDGLSISDDPSNVDKLKALVADADRALDKAEQIKRVNDRYDAVADAGTKQDLATVKDIAVQEIQDADDDADIERIADQAILEISQTEAIDRINAAVDSEKYGELADNTVTAATDDINSYDLDNITDINTVVADIAQKADDTVFAIQKIYAKDDAQNDADALKDKIDGMVADGNMTQEQANALKNDITNALNDALTDGEKNIDNVANAAELGEVVCDFNTALDTVEEEATLKSETVKKVKDELAEIKEHINALGSVSDDAKTDYAEDADDVLSALHAALLETDTEDGIEAAEQSAIEALDKIKTDSAYVNNAQEEIYDKRDELLDEINDHSYLDDDTKADMIADVNEAVSAAEVAIAGTDDHGAIDTAKQTALDTLNGISQSGTAANNSAKESQLADATDALNDKATAVKEHIDSLTYITDEEKAELKADADKALADALDELSSVNSTGNINKTVSDGVEALDKAKSDADKQNGAAKDTQTALADSELDSKRNETVAKIDGLDHLTDEEKDALKKELDDTLADAKSAVDGAESAEAITAAKTDGIADIQKIADNAETKNLENAKSSAIDELEAKTEELIATIDAFKYLEDEEKAALKKELEDKLSAAADKINDAESVNDVADIKTAALSELGEYNKKALADEDEALVDKLIPIMITLGVLLVAEAIALAVLLIKRPKATGMAAFAPIGIGALKLQPTGAWTLTGVLAAADVILAALIVWLVIERIRASKAAAVEAPAPEPEPVPEPEPEPEEEPVQIETVESITVEEAEQMMTDEEARQCEETDFVDTEVYTGAKKAEINIDVISRNFEAGDTVTLNSLKAKGLVPKQAGYVKVLARGTLDKPLTVIAQSFSMAAVKMIVLTGGTTILTHSSPERQ